MSYDSREGTNNGATPSQFKIILRGEALRSRAQTRQVVASESSAEESRFNPHYWARIRTGVVRYVGSGTMPSGAAGADGHSTVAARGWDGDAGTSRECRL